MNVYENLHSPWVKVNGERSVPGGFGGLFLLQWGSSFSNCSDSEPREVLERSHPQGLWFIWGGSEVRNLEISSMVQEILRHMVRTHV